MSKFYNYKTYCLSFLLTAAFLAGHCQEPADREIDAYNLGLGVHTIGPKYKFTDQSYLFETASEIKNLGSGIIKIHTSPNSYQINYSGSLVQLFENEPSFRYVLNEDFYHYFMWVRSNANWSDGYSDFEKQADYQAIYDFTAYLMEHFSGSGKKFFIGHWEGDWYLLKDYNRDYIPSATEVQGMIDWMNNRQKAVEDARRDHDNPGVSVYNYLEINQVYAAYLDEEKIRVVNKVLPFTNVDYVSYSCYDIQNLGETSFMKVLDYVESKLVPREDIQGKRVIIGEFGVPASNVGFMEGLHEEENRNIIRKALKWGSPYILYWQMYDNEYNASNDSYRGFWLINHEGEKQSLYDSFYWYYKNARVYLSNFRSLAGRMPTPDEFQSWALQYLSKRPSGMTEQILDAEPGISLPDEPVLLSQTGHHGTIWIDLPQKWGNPHYMLHDIYGRLVGRGVLQPGKNLVNVTGSGMFLITIQSREKSFTRKFIQP